MGIRVAYGKKENIQAAIFAGIVPKDSVIFTNDKEGITEIFFYDAQGVLSDATQRDAFMELVDTVTANTVAIEAERQQRVSTDEDISALIEQLAKSHAETVDELRATDTAMATKLDEIETTCTEKNSALQDLIEQMGIRVESISNDVNNLSTSVGAVNESVLNMTTTINELDSRVSILEKSGGSSVEVVEQITTLEASMTVLEETKLSKDEVVEVTPDAVDDVFNEVFNANE